jgi:hypothetical protein
MVGVSPNDVLDDPCSLSRIKIIDVSHNFKAQRVNLGTAYRFESREYAVADECAGR